MQHLRMNDLVLWKAIEWSVENGYKMLDFGRTDIENTGLRRFKAGWGSEEYPIRYYKYDVKHKVFVKNRWGRLDAIVTPAFGMMPIPVSRMIGTMLYRHLG